MKRHFPQEYWTDHIHPQIELGRNCTLNALKLLVFRGQNAWLVRPKKTEYIHVFIALWDSASHFTYTSSILWRQPMFCRGACLHCGRPLHQTDILMLFCFIANIEGVEKQKKEYYLRQMSNIRAGFLLTEGEWVKDPFNSREDILFWGQKQ